MISEISVLVIGIIVGAIILWLATRSKFNAKEVQLHKLTSELDVYIAKHNQLQNDANYWYTQLAVFEEKSTRIPILEQEGNKKQEEILKLNSEITQLKEEQARLVATIQEANKASEEKFALLNESKLSLENAFKALAAEALNRNNEAFLQLANASLEKFHQGATTDLTARQVAIDGLIQPLQVALARVDGKITEIEHNRIESYSTLTEQVRSMSVTQMKLESETSNLVKALRSPQVRGRWGELQLKRVVELAGMLEHCDFNQQTSVNTELGRLRPDLIIKLPNNKNVVVDAKCPLEAYLEALSCTDEDKRDSHLERHARQVADHITKLAAKSYFDQFEPTPEFVVMFLPGETFFSAALEQDPSLIEAGAGKNVILATPTTLIALLKAVCYGWKQESVAKNAQAVSDLGKELYERIRMLAEHFSTVGNKLDGAVESYNKAAGTLDNRILVTARKFKELGCCGEKEIQTTDRVDKTTRTLQASELLTLQHSKEHKAVQPAIST